MKKQAPKREMKSKCFKFILFHRDKEQTALLWWQADVFVEALLRNSLGKRKQHSATSLYSLITAPHKNYVFLHLTLRGNGFMEMLT